ncbi:DUF4328 domain-containing protein [Streptomyces sp. NPDC059525]|uniref:DUF4328 domain-containing protein n=1 Tax=Streptomyces sp. NPDC059525 TaxID=3346857 RepID=UPI0036C449C9
MPSPGPPAAAYAGAGASRRVLNRAGSSGRRLITPAGSPYSTTIGTGAHRLDQQVHPSAPAVPPCGRRRPGCHVFTPAARPAHSRPAARPVPFSDVPVAWRAGVRRAAASSHPQVSTAPVTAWWLVWVLSTLCDSAVEQLYKRADTPEGLAVASVLRRLLRPADSRRSRPGGRLRAQADRAAARQGHGAAHRPLTGLSRPPGR